MGNELGLLQGELLLGLALVDELGLSLEEENIGGLAWTQTDGRGVSLDSHACELLLGLALVDELGLSLLEEEKSEDGLAWTRGAWTFAVQVAA
jgi:hypothetical protein